EAQVDDLSAGQAKCVAANSSDAAASAGAVNATRESTGGAAGSYEGIGQATLRLIDGGDLPAIHEVAECAFFLPRRAENRMEHRALPNIKDGVAVLVLNVERVEQVVRVGEGRTVLAEIE